MLNSLYTCVWAPCLMDWVIKKGNCGPNPVCALLWLIEESEKGNISWLLKQHFFFHNFSSWTVDKGKGGAGGSRAGQILSPSHLVATELWWDWRSEKSCKKLTARGASGYAEQISRFLHSLICLHCGIPAYLLSISSCPLASVSSWNKRLQLTLCHARSMHTVCHGVAGLGAAASSARAPCPGAVDKWVFYYTCIKAVTGMHKGIGTLWNLSFLGCYIPEERSQKVNFSSALQGFAALNQYPDLGTGTQPVWHLPQASEQRNTWTLPCLL